MEEIINILMRRDGITRREAKEAINECQKEINEVIENGGSLSEVEDAIAYWLGLEPDYLMLFL